jgi:hypothetical protein
VDALVMMTRRGIHHLTVTSQGRLVGVISSSDVGRLELSHPVGLSRAIGAATSFDALKRLGPDILQITRRLVSAGASALDVGGLVAELNDQLVQRVLTLTAEQLAAGGDLAPVPYCWLACGSEARREQTLRTDQDNGLVYAEPPPGEAAAAASYYPRFSDAAVRGLMTIGFPACPGSVMASNPALCRPLSGWLENFARWMDLPTSAEVLAASIHFDLRHITGAMHLGSELNTFIARDAPKRRVSLGMLARDVVWRRPRLTLSGRVAARRGHVDIKGAVTMPLVGARSRARARVTRSQHGEAVPRAGAHGLYTAADTTEMAEAYQHAVRLRLVHQLAQLDEGDVQDNWITPRTVSRADGLLLRNAFRAVGLVQAALRQRFGTDLLGWSVGWLSSLWQRPSHGLDEPLDALRQRGFIAIDLETRGLDPRRDRIVAVAAVKFIEDDSVPALVTLVNPAESSPASATRIHGVDDAIITRAPDEATAVERLDAILAGEVIVGHGVAFDVAVLARARGAGRARRPPRAVLCTQYTDGAIGRTAQIGSTPYSSRWSSMNRSHFARRSSPAWAKYAAVSESRCPPQLELLTLQLLEPRALVVRQAGPGGRCHVRHRLRSVSAAHSIFSAVEVMAAHCDAWASACSNTSIPPAPGPPVKPGGVQAGI